MSYTDKEKRATVKAYRAAAKELFNVSDVELETYIIHPNEDRGEWAPHALAVIYLEPDCRKSGDEGMLPGLLSYWNTFGHENCYGLAEKAGIGFIEYINAAVAAVYE